MHGMNDELVRVKVYVRFCLFICLHIMCDKKNTLVSIRKIYLKMQFTTYVVGSKSFRPDIEKPRQMENAVKDI